MPRLGDVIRTVTYMPHHEHALLDLDVDVRPTTPPTPRNMVRMRVAMLGDDQPHMFLLRRTLLTAGHTAQRYRTASEFLNAVNNTSFDILILGSIGDDSAEMEVISRLRGQLNLTVPIIVAATRRSEDYIVQALRLGADDCIALPVGQREFLARVEAVARRWIHVPAPVHSFRAGRITVHVQSRRILVDHEPVELTSKDFDLAVFLLRNVGRLVTRNQILHAVWGFKQQLIRSRTLDTHMSRVRRRLKLVESEGWRLSAVYRRGYRLERLKNDKNEESED